MASIHTSQSDIAVIGAGAAGLTAALSAGINGASVSLIEGGDRVGRKILSTGNGRCNLSHTDIDPSSYHGSGRNRAGYFLEKFGTDSTIDFFRKLGLLTRDREGCIYPYSEQASAVLNVLRAAVSSADIPLLTDAPVDDLRASERGFDIFSHGNRIASAKKVILCTGGCAAPKTGSDGSGIELARRLGHKIVPVRPALVKLISDSALCRSLDGVRARALAKVFCSGTFTELSEYGEIQFTKDGLSGIPIFDLSAGINAELGRKNSISVHLDLLPEYDADSIRSFILEHSPEDDISAELYLSGIVNKKLCTAAMKLAGIGCEQPASSISEKKLSSFINILKDLAFEIKGSYGFEQAQVTSGGVDFSEIGDDLQSGICPGLYFAGEILDIDGICGGYNLQWAWTSGYLAGCQAAGKNI